MLITKISAALGLVSISISAIGANQTPDPKAPFKDRYEEAVYFLTPIFPVLDCEGMGEIEDGDVDEHFHSLFFYNDRDQSKYIVESEFLLGRAKESSAQSRFVFVMMDSNGDGKVSAYEYRQYVSQSISFADIDQNGEVNLTELQANKNLTEETAGAGQNKTIPAQASPAVGTIDNSREPIKIVDKHAGHNHE
jgi:hypothetical protein